MKLYTYYRSSAAYRVRIALNLKGIAHSHEAINLREQAHKTAAFLRINPEGLLPALAIDDNHVLAQSSAIIEYLEERYPDPPLLPDDAYARAQVRRLCSIVACDIHPICNMRVLQYIDTTLSAGTRDRQAWIHHWMHQGFTALESVVQAAPFAMGNTPTLADVFIVPQLYNAKRFGVDMTPYPRLAALFHQSHSHPAFAQAAPARQADANGADV